MTTATVDAGIAADTRPSRTTRAGCKETGQRVPGGKVVFANNTRVAPDDTTRVGQLLIALLGRLDTDEIRNVLVTHSGNRVRIAVDDTTYTADTLLDALLLAAPQPKDDPDDAKPVRRLIEPGTVKRKNRRRKAAATPTPT